MLFRADRHTLSFSDAEQTTARNLIDHARQTHTGLQYVHVCCVQRFQSRQSFVLFDQRVYR